MLHAVAGALLEFLNIPAGPRHANDGNMKPASAHHGVQSRKYLLVRRISCGAEKYESIRFQIGNLASCLQLG